MKPRYMSPTSLMLFYDDRELYYLRYLSDNPPPRDPQTEPMAIGSAFDAYVKAYLYSKLCSGGDQMFEFETLFETQVEPHVRDFARQHGAIVWEEYQRSGALIDLMTELTLAYGEPQFESRVEATIGGVPFMGKPDVFFVTKTGEHVILDFKVNGYCSKASPKKGYTKLRDKVKGNGVHKDCVPISKNGIIINCAQPMNVIDEKWATQLSIYAWCLGEPVESDYICGIDQIAGPEMRIATYRGTVQSTWQAALLLKAQVAWEAITNDKVVSEEDAKRLNLLAKGMADPRMAQVTRRAR